MGFTEGQNAVVQDGKFVKWTKKDQSITGLVESISFHKKFERWEVELIVEGEPKVVSLITDLESKFIGTFGAINKVPKGVKVEITWVGSKNTGQAQDMKLFRLRVDTDTLPAGFILNPEPEVDPEIGY